jgi:hypothetical protein
MVMAYDPEDVGSKPTAGNPSILAALQKQHLVYRHIHIFHRDGAEGARGAHNSEDVGSRPTSGIISLRSFYRSDQT